MSAEDYLTRKESRVKNKSQAPIQITAEHILREARERQEPELRPPNSKITDPAELDGYRLRKRNEFEDLVRRVRWNTSAWVKYAQWEASQNDFNRARSVWERAVEVDYRNHTLWLKYAEAEIKNKSINHARNVFDRAVMFLPRIDQLWYKYVHMEEMLGNVAGAREVFERWMNWMPDQQGWLSYIEFEVRYGEIDRARVIFKRLVQCHPNVYKRAMEKLAVDEEGFVAFAELEELGKQYGDREGGEDDAIVGKRRLEYEDQVRENPLDYDSWFDYIRLEESVGDKERVRHILEKAIANVPPAEEKRYWGRYIYLWIHYALYEELDARDVDQTRDVYRACLNLIPHRKFSFAKVWILAAQFEIRQLNLKAARQILGNAIGKAPKKDKIFKKYIEMELQLGNIDRCRRLYEKYLEWAPENCYAWSKYAELERSLWETDRARSIFELAIAQPALDMPELLWKAYIDFETAEGKFQRARVLYQRLLHRTKHLKFWISYAEFEATAMDEGLDLPEQEQKKQCIQRARRVFEDALDYFASSLPSSKEERSILLEKWLNFEASSAELGDVSLVQPKLPKKVKKRRHVTTEEGCTRMEEFTDYIFPEETHTSNLRILEAAYNWKRQKLPSGDLN